MQIDADTVSAEMEPPPRHQRPIELRHGRWIGAGRQTRNRVALALVLALGLGVLVWALIDGVSPTTKSPASSGPTPAAVAAGVKDVLRATNVVTTAGTTMSVAMAGLHTLPTVVLVSAIVQPYGAALQRYETTLGRATLGTSAAPWRASVVAQAQRLSQSLATLPTTPSAQLGGWISSYELETAELQSAIEALESALGHHSS